MFDESAPEPRDLPGLADADLVDAAWTTTRAENRACARKLAVMAELFDRRTRLAPHDRLDWWVDPAAAVTAEIAAAHHITQGLALHQTYRGVVLRDRLPRVGALFLDGLISELLVRTIITRTDLITDEELIAAVDAELADQILGWGPLSAKKTEAEIDAIVKRHDPDAVRQPPDPNTGRAVEFGNPADAPGFTTLWARMFDCDAAAAEHTLTAVAYSVCDNDPRSLDDRRNDALHALLTANPVLACLCGNTDCDAATNPRPLREIVVYALTDHTTATAEPPSSDTADNDSAAFESNKCRSDETPDVRDDEGDKPQPDPTAPEATEPEPKSEAAPAPKPRPGASALIPGRSAYIFGSGFMPTPLFDALLADATIREVIHPGQAAPEPGYAPSAALAAFIRCRDLTCRFPGCDKPATTADIDHTVPHPIGPTHPSNLKALCRFHHLLKTFWNGPNGWRDRQHPDGTIEWTSPTGHTYTTHPASRLLFPVLCRPTASLWTGDPPEVPMSANRGAMMPRRTRTRAQSRAAYITAERRRNAEIRAAEAAAENRAAPPRDHDRDEFTGGERKSDYGNDPPPF
ncbi:HNH endonuclease [Mycolicibacterium parafortuitum]|uniref:DUF222 domain-containing protein n=1 Tax=Mycolicibacterium parafortuitum TaxID=39692 RepID=UPI0032C420B4